MRTAIERTVFVLILLAPIAALFAARGARSRYDRAHPEPPYPRRNVVSEADEDRRIREWERAYHDWNEQGWREELTAFGVVYGVGLASWLGLVVYRVRSQALLESIILLLLPLALYFIVGYMMFIGYGFRYG
jgi:hypothetical protein